VEGYADPRKPSDLACVLPDRNLTRIETVEKATRHEAVNQ
jgi:hypothetical protein